MKKKKRTSFKRKVVVDMKWFRVGVLKKKKQFMKRKGSPLKPSPKLLP